MIQVKVCGVTRVEDALAAVEAGADAIGLNFVEGTPRALDEKLAALIERLRTRLGSAGPPEVPSRDARSA